MTVKSADFKSAMSAIPSHRLNAGYFHPAFLGRYQHLRTG